ncbi:MAG: hypothetical protein ACTSU2_00015 [Promethearchaeota archaeon]
MSNPPPPKMPPILKKKISETDMCIIHKGPLEGDVYVCPKCGAKMCMSCVLKRKKEGNPFCPKCQTIFVLK